MDDYIKDGICPACGGNGYMDGEEEVYNDETDEYEEGTECDGWGRYGCDEGEMIGATWKEIMAFDQQNVDRQKSKDEYPGDDEVVKQVAAYMKQMDDPRQAFQQMKIDYPHMGMAQRSGLLAKAKQIAFPESITEGEERSIIQSACIEKLVDEFAGEERQFKNKDDMEYAIYQELERLDVADCVDPRMEVGGQPIGNFASGRVIDVVSANDVIYDVMQNMDLSQLEEGTFVAQKSAVIDSILRKLKDEAQDDDELLRQLAKMISKKADPRLHNRPTGKWQLGDMEPIEENASKEQIEAKIKQLQPMADKLEFGKSEARDITKAIKYSNDVTDIMVQLSTLADKLGIDEKELDYYERQVYEAKNRLESAVYEMEEVFQDKYKEVAYKIEELDMDLDDIEFEMRNESTEMMTEEQFDEAAGKKDACYHKVKSRYKVWPSAYASGALVQCRKKGAANWGSKSKKK